MNDVLDEPHSRRNSHISERNRFRSVFDNWALYFRVVFFRRSSTTSLNCLAVATTLVAQQSHPWRQVQLDFDLDLSHPWPPWHPASRVSPAAGALRATAIGGQDNAGGRARPMVMWGTGGGPPESRR